MKILVNGCNIAYDTAGEGIPLLFIHGFPLNKKMWIPQISGLAPYARIILPDLRGYGESDPSPDPYTMDQLAEDCISLMNTLGITQPAVVCGLSMGGYIAFAMYRKFADRIAGLILTATRASSETAEGKANRDRAIKLAQSEGPEAIADTMLPKLFAPSTYTSQYDLISQVRTMMASTSVNSIVGALSAMRERQDSTPLLPSITVPVQIIHGEQDQLIPVQIAHDMQSSIPGSTLNTIDGAGHLLNLEKPLEFNQVVHRFLNQF